MGNSESIQLESTITCPHCATQKIEIMPTEACQYLYECLGCHAILKANPGDCCVFCSFGTVPCPPIQEQQQTKGKDGKGWIGP